MWNRNLGDAGSHPINATDITLHNRSSFLCSSNEAYNNGNIILFLINLLDFLPRVLNHLLRVSYSVIRTFCLVDPKVKNS